MRARFEVIKPNGKKLYLSELFVSDMVGAYKMLESQKQSLEIALSVLSVDVPERITNDGQLTMGNSTGTEQQQAIGAATTKTSESEAAEKNDKQVLLLLLFYFLIILNLAHPNRSTQRGNYNTDIGQQGCYFCEIRF